MTVKNTIKNFRQKQLFLPEVFCSYHSVTFVSLLFVLELPPSKASLTK